ncbi:hypothetical protein HPB49_023228 [Dermacentor silvarum]|uniref:Uncharacterized protein n=1 Tax=Dermacentor silvarum TaxID=543639 RepID=A0ACB8CTF1_DERSI|nr:hypothetical protein HPB49_023228 [Dermacentor silvarum]
MSTAAAPKSDSRTKFKSKLSFLHSTSTGASSSLSNKQANLPELLALLTTQQRADEDERLCAVVGNTIEPLVSRCLSKGELLTTPATTSSDKEGEESVSEVVENETSFTGEEEAILDEKAEPKALTVSDVVVRKVREVHLENGLCQEDDLLDDLLGSSKAPLILEGTPTAFLHRGSAYRPFHEDLYSFSILYRDLDDEDNECGCLRLVQDAVTAGSRLPRSNDSGRQYTVAVDFGPRRARANSSNGKPCEAAVEGEDEEQNKRRKKDGWSQVPSPARRQPRALQALQQTCDAEAPGPGVGYCPVFRRARVIGAEAKRRNRGALLTSLPETLRRSRAREVQQLRVKIDKLLEIAGNTSAESGRVKIVPRRRVPASTNAPGSIASYIPALASFEPCQAVPAPKPNGRRRKFCTRSASTSSGPGRSTSNLHSIVHYQDPATKNAAAHLSIEDAATAGSRSVRSNNGGRQYAPVADVDGPRRERSRFIGLREFATNGKDEEQETRRRKDGRRQVALTTSSSSVTEPLPALQQTCDADARPTPAARRFIVLTIYTLVEARRRNCGARGGAAKTVPDRAVPDARCSSFVSRSRRFFEYGSVPRCPPRSPHGEAGEEDTEVYPMPEKTCSAIAERGGSEEPHSQERGRRPPPPPGMGAGVQDSAKQSPQPRPKQRRRYPSPRSRPDVAGRSKGAAGARIVRTARAREAAALCSEAVLVVRPLGITHDQQAGAADLGGQYG